MFCVYAYLVPRPGPCSLKILITAWQGTSVFSQCLSCVRDGFCTHFISYVLMVYQGDERRRYRASPSRNPQGYHPFGTDQSSRRHPYRQLRRYLAERATSRRYLAQRANSRRRAAPRGFSEGPVAKADFRNPQKSFQAKTVQTRCVQDQLDPTASSRQDTCNLRHPLDHGQRCLSGTLADSVATKVAQS